MAKKGLDFSFAMDNQSFQDKTLVIRVLPKDALTASGPNQLVLATDDPLSQQQTRKVKRTLDKQNSVGDGSAPNQAEADGKTLKKIMVGSQIFAAQSEYFKTLFSSEMGAPLQQEYVIYIKEGEELALDQIIEYIYRNVVSTRSPVLLAQTMVVADQFGVLKAVGCCASLLRDLKMSREIAMLCLTCSSRTGVVVDALADLRIIAKQFLVNEFKNIQLSEEELGNMPLSVITAVFASSEIAVRSEDQVYLFLVKWVETHHHDKDRVRVFSEDLFPLIRLIHMSPTGLKAALACQLLQPKNKTSPFIINAMLYRSDFGNRRFPLLMGEVAMKPRIYLVKPIHVSNIVKPFIQSVVSVDLSVSDLQQLSATPEVKTQSFPVSDFLHFHLKFRLVEEPAGSGDRKFSMFLVGENFVEPVTMSARFFARRASDGEFQQLHVFYSTFTEAGTFGVLDLFGITWEQFFEDNEFMLDGFLHIRADVRLVE